MAKLGDLVICGTQRQETYLLGYVAHNRVAEHGNVPHDFVNNIGLWGVFWIRVVPDILSRAEDTVGKTVKELPLAQNPHGGSHPEPSLSLQELIKLPQLRQPLRKLKFFIQSLQPLIVSTAHSLFMHVL